ncbi:hypothetical protein CFC21_004770 [Triticum aestivum]|uniref:Dirigent protein n=2 Tax=Triticum aestivum TaxID=4565 RepID=A0A9R1INI9_WHEAT|nr:uncharacterized protein LOC123083848 [Triticum aestivum]KAF6987092.1 hypothetical protein CFC21_004770 [Triticum aestivum]
MAAVILSNTRIMPTSYNKTIMSNLSLHRIANGADTNQATVIQKDYKFGHTAVNDWVIYEGAGPGPVFARGQGSHILAGNSISTIMITFEDPRYKGSSLAVMGNILDNGQWAIVGGTGLFKYATGFIDLVPVQQSSPKNISNITIEVCNPNY